MLLLLLVGVLGGIFKNSLTLLLLVGVLGGIFKNSLALLLLVGVLGGIFKNSLMDIASLLASCPQIARDDRRSPLAILVDQ